MDIRKFEQLINLVRDDNEEQAKELFHEIVVERSREIFESIMAEEMDDGMGGQVGDLLDEIDVEETGMNEEDDEFAFDDGEIELDASDDDFEDDSSEEVEDAVIRIEDKLDQLMADFEEIMAGDDETADFDDEEADFDDETADFDDEEADFDDEEEALAEAIQLKKVSVTHGDDGVNKKSPVAANSGKTGMGSKPVSFAGGDEKGRTAPTSKEVSGASSFKNAPGKDNFKEKGDAAPKAKHGDDGANTKSPVAESRRRTGRRIR